MRNDDIIRPYSSVDVLRLRGSIQESYTVATRAAETLWGLLESKPYVHAMGAVTGNQAMQMVKAGMQAIYCSGWQVAADANDSHEMYPDQKPLSYNVWMHTDTSNVDAHKFEDLPF